MKMETLHWFKDTGLCIDLGSGNWVSVPGSKLGLLEVDMEFRSTLVALKRVIYF
jgi:hypothetical protein